MAVVKTARPIRARRISPTRPLVMGVLNATPDSFSDGGLYLKPDAALERALQMEAEGADLIDVGGMSTRPGAFDVPLDEEQRRVLPVIRRLAQAVRVPLSVDTFRADVAERAADAGVAMVNDITALRGDARMASVVARHKVQVILMHMRGTPHTMQRAPRYRDVVADVSSFLSQAAVQAQEAGIARARILIDPGLGFGKTVGHNLALLRALPRLALLGYPVVIGPSRKSFIGKVLAAEVQDRLAGTLACVAQASLAGAHMVRVHDVKAAVHLLQMLDAIQHA